MNIPVKVWRKAVREVNETMMREIEQRIETNTLQPHDYENYTKLLYQNIELELLISTS